MFGIKLDFGKHEFWHREDGIWLRARIARWLWLPFMIRISVLEEVLCLPTSGEVQDKTRSFMLGFLVFLVLVAAIALEQAVAAEPEPVIEPYGVTSTCVRGLTVVDNVVLRCVIT